MKPKTYPSRVVDNTHHYNGAAYRAISRSGDPITRERLRRMEDVALFRETVKACIGGVVIAVLGWIALHLLFSL